MGRQRARCASLLAIYCATVAACGDDVTFQDAGAEDAAAEDAVAPDAAVDHDAALPPDGGSVADAAIDAGGDPAPGPVTSFATTSAPIGLFLSWVNPGDSDLAGVLIVAGAGVAIDFAPVDGTSYADDESVGTGQTVIHTALATATAHGVPGVPYELAAWAYDDALQYSEVALTTGRNDALGTPTGQIQVFLDGTVVVLTQPNALLLSGTASYDAETDALSLDLSVENQTGRLLFNLKAMVDSSSQGTIAGATYPSAIGQPMRYYGPEALAVGASATRTITIDGVDGTVDPVVLALHFADAPALLASGQDTIALLDSSGSGQSGAIDFPPQLDHRGTPRGGVLGLDARYLYTGSKSWPRVMRLDLTTLTASTSADLLIVSPAGNVSDVAISPDGSLLYALLVDGYHWKGGIANAGGELAAAGGGPATTAYLVELATGTMLENRRVALPGFGTRGHLLVLPDGDRAAIAFRGHDQIYFIDLATFAMIDVDGETAGVQGVTRAQTDHVVLTAAPDASRVIAAQTASDAVDVLAIDTTTYGATSQSFAAIGIDRILRAAVDADDRLLLATRIGFQGPMQVVVVDGQTEAILDDDTIGSATSIALSPDGSRYYLVGWSAFATYDQATDSALDVDGDPENAYAPAVAPDLRDHGSMAVTRF